MIGTVERIKNNVLMKCSTLNDEIISGSLNKVIKIRIYRFAEEMVNLVSVIDVSEEDLRNKIDELISNLIVKKIKRKLFIDSLALQITNDSFIEEYANDKITKEGLEKKYIKELINNKNSNQLNMTEDLDLTEIVKKLAEYTENNIVVKISENETLAQKVRSLVTEFKINLESDLEDLINSTDNKYLDILLQELDIVLGRKEEMIKEEKENNEGEDIMIEEVLEKKVVENNKFDKYDDMTLINKITLSLNTAEENLTRKESKLEEKRKEIEKKLSDTNVNIEANIKRENNLSQRKLELSNREIELNSKLSETEVIFLNIKPLIKGLSKINESSNVGGSINE